MSDNNDLIRTESTDGVIRWTLNRPEALNAFHRPLLKALRKAIAVAQHDRSIRCGIVTGAGEKAFSAGADLKERRGMSLDDTREYVYNIRTTFDAIARLPFPTIAAVNGVAFGGGMELLLACDLRILADHVKIGLNRGCGRNHAGCWRHTALAKDRWGGTRQGNDFHSTTLVGSRGTSHRAGQCRGECGRAA